MPVSTAQNHMSMAGQCALGVIGRNDEGDFGRRTANGIAIFSLAIGGQR
jgi:hypothetical protein